MISRSRSSRIFGRSSTLAASLVFVGLGSHSASAQLLGPEFLVNTYTTSSQFNPAIAADGSGNFIVVWASAGQDGEGEGVFGQRFNAAGGKVGNEFQVNTYTTSAQWHPAVGSDSAGNFVVVWSSYRDGSAWGVFGQRFDSMGDRVGSEFQVNSYTTGYQWKPVVALDALGDFAVVWASRLQDGAGDGIFGQRYSLDGSRLGSEFQVNTFTTSDQVASALAAGGLGSFLAVWQSNLQDGSGSGIFGQRFSLASGREGSEFQVNTYTTLAQQRPAVAADGSGQFVVAWWAMDQNASGVFGQRLSPAGSPVGSEFQVNSYTTDWQLYPAVAADASGNFVVTWNSLTQDGSGYGVFGQRFDSVGLPVGGEFQVNAYTTSEQSLPVAAAVAPGNFVVVWQSVVQDAGGGVFGRQLTTSVFRHDFDATPPFWSDTTATMCSGQCGGQSNAGCYCDSRCVSLRDCCLDACTSCGYCAP